MAERGGSPIEKLNILVFPAGTEIAFEIHRALKYSKFIKLYGATSVPCHAEFVFERCFVGVPFVGDDKLIDELNRIIDANAIDFIFPAHDDALLELARSENRLHAKVVAPCLETVEICRDKRKTYEFFKGADYLPKVYASADEIDSFPVFVKPAIGQGSTGARRVDRAEDLPDGDYVICEYLPGAEYTVDCFTDINGKLRLVSPRTRDRIRAGIAVRTRTFSADKNIRAIAEDINSRLRFNGAWFFQLKKDAHGEYALLEIAPRIAGTMGATRNLGYNLPLLTLYNMMEEKVELMGNGNSQILDRAFVSRFKTDIAYDNVYVDYDDTLVVNGKVNEELISFLYQARNNGKHIFLLSRHDGSILDALEEHAISELLFEGIIVLNRNGSKGEFIKPQSIFIDDSFSERKRVHETTGIPVFDLDAVESLIKWNRR